MTLGGTSTSGGIFVSRENALLLWLLDSPDGHAENDLILMATHDRYRLAHSTPYFPRPTSEPIFNTVRQRAALIQSYLLA